MAAKMQIKTLVANMFSMGLLDEQFQKLQMAQNWSAHDFMADLITLFCKEGERIIGELFNILGKPYADFNKVGDLLLKLQGSSASIGARRVKNRCIQFHEFSRQKSRDGCIKTLYSLRDDFYDLHNKFQNMVRLEHQVRTFYPRQ